MANLDTTRTTRRSFLLGAGVAVAAVAAPTAMARRASPGLLSAAGRTFLSRPDLQPPVLQVMTRNNPSAGKVFLAPFDLAGSVSGKPSDGQFGALIIDDN